MTNHAEIRGDVAILHVPHPTGTRKCVIDRIELSAVEQVSAWYLTTNDIGTPYVVGNVWGGKSPLHDFILDLEEEQGVVDHINGDTLDCRAVNLRSTNSTINALNRHGASCMSGVRGVAAMTGRWQSNVRHASDARYLGRFLDIRDAAHAVWMRLLELDPDSAASFLRSLPAYDEDKFAVMLAASRKGKPAREMALKLEKGATA